MTVYVFYATYFHTEYFFSVLGIRYRFPHVTLYLDSALLGPDEHTAMRNFEKVPVGMYFNAIAFFIIYHTASVVCMRRVRTLTLDAQPWLRHLLWIVTVAAAAYFFAWAETFLYVNNAQAMKNVWYVDMSRMLSLGSACYALYFIVSFPNVYRMDEEPGQPAWTLSRCVIEASFVSMLILLLLDGFAWIVGPIA
jgi:cycloeucalenol cycloisomerase